MTFEEWLKASMLSHLADKPGFTVHTTTTVEIIAAMHIAWQAGYEQGCKDGALNNEQIHQFRRGN